MKIYKTDWNQINIFIIVNKYLVDSIFLNSLLPIIWIY